VRLGVTVGRNASAGRIAAAIRTVLEDPTYRRNAQRLGELVRRDAESDALVTALEELPEAHRTVRAG
jgi:UDP:flavonoid glycosyltransferase YjiC (YdhE family)